MEDGEEKRTKDTHGMDESLHVLPAAVRFQSG